ncbi:MAG: DegV family protein [Ruminococcus sp.]|nr:DegV family protein [Ruminococcus sp.]
MKIKITTDSTADLSPELLKHYDISVVPLYVVMGDKILKDGIEATPEDIYTFVDETGKLPKTSAPNLNDFLSMFRNWRKQGFNVVHFNISSDFSSSHATARMAAEEVGGVEVVDTRNLSTGSGLLVLHACEMAQNGATAAQIAEECRALAGRVEASFVVDSIDYLRMGGRCSSVAALGANLLKLKPCIEVIDGKMVSGKKFRGRIEKVIINYVTERLQNRDDIDKHRVFITHTRCSEEVVEQVRETILQLAPDFQEILETTAGCTVTSHCGPGTLGVLFIRNR